MCALSSYIIILCLIVSDLISVEHGVCIVILFIVLLFLASHFDVH